MNTVLCGECYAIVPARHWFGHRFWHQAQIRMGMLAAGFTEQGATEGSLRAVEQIQPQPWEGLG